MAFKLTKKLCVVVLADRELLPPEDTTGLSEEEIDLIKSEFDVITTLKEMGHEVHPVGVDNDLRVIRKAIEEFKPDVAFNLLVEFGGSVAYEPYVVSYLEMLRQPYTGCNPRGLLLAQDKGLSKKILAYHRIPVPAFAVFPLRRRVRIPSYLKFPLIVKSLTEQGSAAISHASIVHDNDALMDRVQFVQKQTGSHAIAEQYIEGREIYVAISGNTRLQTYTPWDLVITNLPAGAPFIATKKVKWDRKYQQKAGVITRAAELPPEVRTQLDHLSKRIYRNLNLSGYARLDFRLTSEGKFYLLEANPNPNISYGEDFAEAANHCGLSYEQLLQKLLNLGIRYRRS